MTLRNRRILALVVMVIASVASIWLIDRRVQRSVAEHQDEPRHVRQTAAEPIE